MTGYNATNTTSGRTTNAILSDYERIGQFTSDLARNYAYTQQTLLNSLAYVFNKRTWTYWWIITSTYKVIIHFFRHGRRTSPKFGTHVRIETRLALTSNNFDPPHPILIETRSYRRPSGRRLQVAGRPSEAGRCGQISYASLRFLGKCYSININASSLWRKATSHQTTYPWK